MTTHDVRHLVSHKFFFFLGKMYIIVSVIFQCIIFYLQVSSNEGFPAFSVFSANVSSISKVYETLSFM